MAERAPEKRFGPWAGLVLGPIGWALHHQGGSDWAFWTCNAAGPWPTTLLGVLGLLIALAGLVWSWRAWRGEGGDREALHDSVWRFLPALSLLVCALCLVALAFQTIAGLIYVGCLR